MPIELNNRATKELDFTLDGKALSIRKLSLGTQISLQSLLADEGTTNVPADKVAEIIVDALISSDTGERVFTADDMSTILDMDGDVVSMIFREISSFAFSGYKEAKKN